MSKTISNPNPSPPWQDCPQTPALQSLISTLSHIKAQVPKGSPHSLIQSEGGCYNGPCNGADYFVFLKVRRCNYIRVGVWLDYIGVWLG